MADLRLSPGVIFVGRYRIPIGQAEAWRAANREMTDFVEAHLPNTISFDAYLSEDGSEGTSVHVHRDGPSFDAYLAAVGSRIGRGTRIVEVIRIDLYGDPTFETVERMRRMGSWPVGVHAHVNGFGRRDLTTPDPNE